MITWIFAALNTVQPPIVAREAAMVLEKDEPWYWDRLAILDERARARLAALDTRLGDSDWLEPDFSAADLLMVMVLRRPVASNSPDGPKLLGEYPSLEVYVARGEAGRLSNAPSRPSTKSTKRPPSALPNAPMSATGPDLFLRPRNF